MLKFLRYLFSFLRTVDLFESNKSKSINKKFRKNFKLLILKSLRKNKNLQISKYFDSYEFKKERFIHENYENISIEEVYTDISLTKISIKSDIRKASVLPAIFSYSEKPIIIQSNIVSINYSEMGDNMKSPIKENNILPSKLWNLETNDVKLQSIEISGMLFKKPSPLTYPLP